MSGALWMETVETDALNLLTYQRITVFFSSLAQRENLVNIQNYGETTGINTLNIQIQNVSTF